MKKKSPPYALLGALVLGALTIFFFIQYEKAKDKEKADAVAAAKAASDKDLAAARAKQVTVESAPADVRYVYYATEPVEPGKRLSPASYTKKLTPKSILPDAYSDQTDVTGWYATRKIEKGDPLTPRNIGKNLPYMSERISPGMRAVSLKVFNATYNNTGGFVVDGDKVDLLYTVGPKEGLVVNTQLVMQNVYVLYVPGPLIKTDKTDGISPSPSPGDGMSVTFEVTPEQAEALVFMSQVKEGHFAMILRSRKDDSEIKIKPFDTRDYDWYHLTKVQRTVDKSAERVQELAAEIDAKEKTESTQGNTNETTTPTPPSP